MTNKPDFTYFSFIMEPLNKNLNKILDATESIQKKTIYYNTISLFYMPLIIKTTIFLTLLHSNILFN